MYMRSYPPKEEAPLHIPENYGGNHFLQQEPEAPEEPPHMPEKEEAPILEEIQEQEQAAPLPLSFPLGDTISADMLLLLLVFLLSGERENTALSTLLIFLLLL